MDDRPAGAVARKINREIVVVVGWGRAILLQLAHPLIAAAISDGSSFHGGAGSYARRAHRTIGAMLDLTLARTPTRGGSSTRSTAFTIASTDGSARRPASSRLGRRTPRDGRLLVWVHATLVDSLVLTYEQLVGPLTHDEKNQYAAESAWLARELGAPAEMVPSDAAGVASFMGDMHARGEICVGEDARRMADALLAPGIAVAAPVFWTSALITVGLLPDDLGARTGSIGTSVVRGGFSRSERWFEGPGGCCRRFVANGQRRAGET